MLAMQLLFAGHETTVMQIWLESILLLSNPDQWQALLADPDLIPKAIEELLRVSMPGGVGVPRYRARAARPRVGRGGADGAGERPERLLGVYERVSGRPRCGGSGLAGNGPGTGRRGVGGAGVHRRPPAAAPWMRWSRKGDDSGRREAAMFPGAAGGWGQWAWGECSRTGTGCGDRVGSWFPRRSRDRGRGGRHR